MQKLRYIEIYFKDVIKYNLHNQSLFTEFQQNIYNKYTTIIQKQ